MGTATRAGFPAQTPAGQGACAERAQIAAARIVAYDFPDRTPAERAAMLERIGLTRIVWDWREDHMLRFEEEMDALAARRIDVVGLWCPMPLADQGAPDADAALGVIDPHITAQVESLHARGMRPDLWTCVEFGQEGTPARLSPRIQRARVRRSADHLEPLALLAREHGMCLALTNHLGWFGEPENQVEVIEELGSRGLRNVGIAYQLQHGHHHAHRFAEVLATMQEHLVAVALSGMDADGVQTGRKILPWGAGRLDRKLAHLLMASGWEGQIAVQGHSADDAEPRLLDSLEGIEWMLDRWRGIRHDRPVPRIATPAWPAPVGIAGPYMGMSLMSRRLRRRLVESGEAAPTLARVRTSPPEPEPITLPPRVVDDVADAAAAPAVVPAVASAAPMRSPEPVPTSPERSVPDEAVADAPAAADGMAPPAPAPAEPPAAADVAPLPSRRTRRRDGAPGAASTAAAATSGAEARGAATRREAAGGAPTGTTSAGATPPVPAAEPASPARSAESSASASAPRPRTTAGDGPPVPPQQSEPRRARGGAAGALAAIHAARQQFSDSGVPALADLPGSPTAGTSGSSASRAGTPRADATAEPAVSAHPLSPLSSAPRRGRAYRPERDDSASELPLRIARREVSLEAPDPYTGAIHALLSHLEAVGFRGAPRSFGWDAQGRHLVEWVDGTRADHADAPAGALDPARIGAFMREMHDALASFVPPADAQWFDGLPGPGGDVIIHQDIAPSNLVIAPDGRLVAIDWDAAAPGTRLWDIAHAIHAFAPLHGQGFELASQAERMRAFADGYGLDDAERERLLPLLSLRSERMHDYLAQMRATGESPWLELWERGVGEVWEADARWIRAHEPDWRDALLG
ncbi:hypothetical protein [Demequina sp. NBRC 110056]|uniref:hypothetical protein n=1 Tax=Demequina sp. NBRC 110056 TaxID=1570345 RepID=UPI000A030B5E|nr:hypothetical protein [Demequina sp. NBRC 110056]